MPLTVAGVRAEIITRIGGKWSQAGLSATTNAPNPPLDGAARDGLYYVGKAPADPLAVVDSDLASVPATRAKAYLDAATLEALYAARGNLPDAYDQQVEQEKQSLHQIATDLDAMIADYQRRVPKLNVPKAAVGSLAAGATVPFDAFRPFDNIPLPCSWPYPQ